jgi:hypothetical protein
VVVSTPEKFEFVSWDVKFPIYGKITFMFQTTNQICIQSQIMSRDPPWSNEEKTTLYLDDHPVLVSG